MITKAKLQQSLKNMPDSFSLDELVDRAILLDKIERGNQQSLNNDVLSEEDLEAEMKKWFK